MKKNLGKHFNADFLSQPIILSLLAAISISLLIILALWGFELRSFVKWFFQSGLLAIPLGFLLYFFLYRKNQIPIELNGPIIIIGTITSVLFASQLVPTQITPTRSIVVFILTAFLFLVIYNLIIFVFINNLKISWEKIALWIIFISGLIGVALIIRNSLFARLYSDDFCYAVNYDQLGFPGAALYFYRDWSGRIFSNFLVMGLTDKPRTIVYLIILTMVSIFSAIFVIKNSKSVRERWFYSFAASLFIVMTISIAAPDFYKTFFWICSALILFPAFIMIPVDLVGAFQLIQRKSKHPVFLILMGGLLSFCIATTHEVAAMGWLALNGAGLIWTLLFNKKNTNLKYFFITAIFAVLIGLGVLLASPGVKNRAQIQQYPGSTPILQTIPIVFKNFLELIKNIANPYYTYEADGRSGWLLIISVIGMGWLADFHLERKWRSALIVLVITFGAILAASFPAAYVYRGNIPLRTQTIPVFFLTLGAFIMGALLPKPKKMATSKAILLLVITSVFLGMRIVIPQMLSIMEPLQQYADDWDSRDKKYIISTNIPPRIDIPWDEYEQNIDCIELYYAHLTELSQLEN